MNSHQHFFPLDIHQSRDLEENRSKQYINLLSWKKKSIISSFWDNLKHGNTYTISTTNPMYQIPNNDPERKHRNCLHGYSAGKLSSSTQSCFANWRIALQYSYNDGQLVVLKADKQVQHVQNIWKNKIKLPLPVSDSSKTAAIWKISEKKWRVIKPHNCEIAQLHKYIDTKRKGKERLVL